jgi:hypothetical protein
MKTNIGSFLLHKDVHQPNYGKCTKIEEHDERKEKDLDKDTSTIKIDSELSS